MLEYRDWETEMETPTGYRKLIIYNKSKELVLLVYQITRAFPTYEIHGLVSQMRRSAVSIPANLVEGYVKSTSKEFLRYLDISLGSLAELQFYFELTLELKYIDQTIYNKSEQACLEIARLFRSFQKSLRAKVDR
jgi:four helix bundle protein